MPGIGYFDRIAIIHLKERTDRYRSVERELARFGLSIRDPKVVVPDAPRPESANGFDKRATYGNFLSHLGILKQALSDGLEHVLVLEDDATFHRSARLLDLARLLDREWDMCYFGYTGDIVQTRDIPRGLVPYRPEYGSFYQAHCYAVHCRCLPELIGYMEETLVNPPGHARGGRMYIDAAFTFFRMLHPKRTTLIANPVLCRQKGCRSSIASGHRYDRVPGVAGVAQLMRAARDELWRAMPIGWHTD